jgi:hypothetical protein
MTGVICATTELTGYTTAVTSGPIVGTCALTVAMFAGIFEMETTEKHAVTAVTFARTSAIYIETVATCARIDATSATIAGICVMISENNRIGLGEGRRRLLSLLPPFFATLNSRPAIGRSFSRPILQSTSDILRCHVPLRSQ